ncbi:MAG: tRNA (adenosine(37)-N6)-threonylcarbamoyltransferase complex dimerization subunit type 1 TsaB [Actinomycetota bacterium]
MLVLGIETSTAVSSVAIGSEQGIVGSAQLGRGKGHEQFVVPAIRFILEQAEVPVRQLAGVAVGVGPGLFTGMRVGVATAKTMAQALRIPIIGIPSLDLLAYSVRHSPRLICACVDARRGEIFSSFYRQVPGGVQRLSEYQAWPPARLADEVQARSDEVLFVGDGALVYRDKLNAARAEFASQAQAFPTASALVELAIPRFVREDTDPLLELEPLYVRKTDAEIAWERQGVVIKRPDRVKIAKRQPGEEST